jgi:SOS-response transcriptional repressor LexA
VKNRGRPATRQRELLDYVHSMIRRDGVAPSYRMIQRDLDVGTPGEVRKLVCRLEKVGKLKRVGTGRVRRIQLVVNSA